MKKELTHHESFAPISRGLRKHFHDMNSAMVKLYIYILLSVKPIGEKKGSFSIAATDLADEMNWNTQTLYRTIKRLNYFISVEYPKNRHTNIEISVRKYKGINEFYRIKKQTGKVYGNDTVMTQYRDGKVYGNDTVMTQYRDGKVTVTIDKDDNVNELQAPNNLDTIDNIDTLKTKEKENTREREESSPKKNFSIYRKTSEALLKRVLEVKQRKISEDELKTWDEECSKMCEIEGATIKDIQKIINECFDMEPSATGFTWKNNINSMAALRKQWNKGNIWLGMNEQQKRTKFGRQEVSKDEIKKNAIEALKNIEAKEKANNGKQKNNS